MHNAVRETSIALALPPPRAVPSLTRRVDRVAVLRCPVFRPTPSEGKRQCRNVALGEAA
jgi:hypothetical protein